MSNSYSRVEYPRVTSAPAELQVSVSTCRYSQVLTGTCRFTKAKKGPKVCLFFNLHFIFYFLYYYEAHDSHEGPQQPTTGPRDKQGSGQTPRVTGTGTGGYGCG